MPRWVLPAIIFLLLIFAAAHRMEVTTMTRDGAKLVFVRDRWSGHVVEKIYTLASYRERSLDDNDPTPFDIAWLILTLLSFVWLYWAIKKTLQEKQTRGLGQGDV